VNVQLKEAVPFQQYIGSLKDWTGGKGNQKVCQSSLMDAGRSDLKTGQAFQLSETTGLKEKGPGAGGNCLT